MATLPPGKESRYTPKMMLSGQTRSGISEAAKNLRGRRFFAASERPVGTRTQDRPACSLINTTKLSVLTLIQIILYYLLTPWSRVLLEKLAGFAANQEIPRILWNPKVH